MNPLRKAVRDYLTRRRGLGFKMARHELGLQDFVSFLERKHSPLSWRWSGQRNIRTTHLESGPCDSPSCAASPGIGVRPIP